MLAFLLLMALPTAHADDNTAQALFDEGGRQYALGNHLQAAQQYEALIASHGVSAPVLFNLGTAQLEAGNLGEASATLLAAARLAPGDRSIARNLEQARFRARETAPLSPVAVRAPGFLSPDAWTALACGAWWLSCALAGAVLLRADWRGRLRGVTAGAFAASALLSATAVITVLDRAGPPLVFVSAANTPVRRAPLRESEVGFSLNDGAAVRVHDTLGEWRLVRVNDGREGWVSTAAIAVPVVR